MFKSLKTLFAKSPRDKSLQEISPSVPKSENMAKSIDLEWPESLIGEVPAKIQKLTQHPRFEIMAMDSGQDAAGDILVLGKDPLKGRTITEILPYIDIKAAKEKISKYKDHTDAPVEAHCMACGRALISQEEKKVISSVALNVWVEKRKSSFTGAPERHFCSWGHLADYLRVVPDEAHLWMACTHLMPGVLRGDNVVPDYITRLKAKHKS